MTRRLSLAQVNALNSCPEGTKVVGWMGNGNGGPLLRRQDTNVVVARTGKGYLVRTAQLLPVEPRGCT